MKNLIDPALFFHLTHFLVIQYFFSMAAHACYVQTLLSVSKTQVVTCRLGNSHISNVVFLINSC